jgi:hypothetical protein
MQSAEVLTSLMKLLQYPGTAKVLNLHLRTLLIQCIAIKKKHATVLLGAAKKKTEFTDVLNAFTEMCERKGGQKAYATIKSCIPDYMRCRKQASKTTRPSTARHMARALAEREA